VQVTRDPREVARDVRLSDDRVDLRDRREPRVPHGLRVIAAEGLHEIGKPPIRDH
jgi:hypothetical protein